jgi:hypothetical protein
MKSKKITFFVLVVVLILLVTSINPKKVWASARQVELPDQSFATSARVAALNTAVSFGKPLGHSFAISNDGTLEEVEPAIAYNSRQQEYLVVYWNDRPGNDDIRAERVSAAGKLLGGFWVSAGSGHDRRHPDVAYDYSNNEYLVVWEDYIQAVGQYTIQGRLISATGGFVSDEPIQGISVGSAPSLPAVAYSSTSRRFMVVWQEVMGTSPTTWESIVGQLVNDDGSMYGSKFTIAQDAGGQPRHRPNLAYNRARNDFLVVWEQKYAMGTDYDIVGRLVASDGTLGSSWIDMPRSTDEESRPRVAVLPTATSNGTYLVVWQEDGSPMRNVDAQLVSGLGSLVGSVHGAYGVTPGSYLISNVGANENTQQFLLVVKGGTNQAMGQALAADFSSWSFWYELDSGPGADHPAVAGGPGGQFLVAFDRSPAGTRDIYGQLWDILQVYLPLVRR